MSCGCTAAVTTLTLPGWQFSCLASLLAFGVTMYSYLAPNKDLNIQDVEKVQNEYDFIIIGGGSAGAVVANRLSEESSWTVLLLEAGCQETVLTDIPYPASYLQNTKFDWQYRTEPPTGDQQYCLSMVNNSCKYPRGKAVGGTSVINYMLYVRGNKLDYDNWEAMGNTGWSYQDVLRYFKKSEDNTDANLLASRYHALGGPLTIGYGYTSNLAGTFKEAAAHLGYNVNQDYNGWNQSTFAVPQGTVRDGSRCSTSKAFIAPVQNRCNLFISMCSFVENIGFHQAGNCKPKAVNVTFVKNNHKYVVRAKKEIILCAGAISSPKILMLSGVGPKDHLNELGIKVIKNSKVGHNLQDHVGAPMSFYESDKNLSVPRVLLNPGNSAEYFLNHSGPYTSLSGIDGIAFVNSRYAPVHGLYPDVQFLTTPFDVYNTGQRPIGNFLYNFRPNLFEGTEYNNLENRIMFTIFSSVLRPESRGRVKLRSKNPYDSPVIIPNYYSSEMDVKRVIEGFRLARELVATPPFQADRVKPLDIPFPGCEKYELNSFEYLNCYIRHFTMTLYDPVGTCAMGVGKDAVVDPELRVYGVDSLRVVDASVMPTITSGSTNAPTIMIGEKGADLIKREWYYKDATSCNATQCDAKRFHRMCCGT